MLVGHRPGGCGGDGRDHCAALEPISEALGIVGFVGERSFGWSDGPQKRQRHADVGKVARCQGERSRSATTISQAIDFAREAAARATDGLASGPLSACGRPMSLHVGGIQYQLVRDRACGHYLGKQALPDTALRLPIVACRVRAVSGRRVMPAARRSSAHARCR